MIGEKRCSCLIFSRRNRFDPPWAQASWFEGRGHGGGLFQDSACGTHWWKFQSSCQVGSWRHRSGWEIWVQTEASQESMIRLGVIGLSILNAVVVLVFWVHTFHKEMCVGNKQGKGVKKALLAVALLAAGTTWLWVKLLTPEQRKFFGYMFGTLLWCTFLTHSQESLTGDTCFGTGMGFLVLLYLWSRKIHDIFQSKLYYQRKFRRDTSELRKVAKCVRACACTRREVGWGELVSERLVRRGCGAGAAHVRRMCGAVAARPPSRLRHSFSLIFWCA